MVRIKVSGINSAIYPFIDLPHRVYMKRAFRGVLVRCLQVNKGNLVRSKSEAILHFFFPAVVFAPSSTYCTSPRSSVTARLSHPSNHAFAPFSHASDQNNFPRGRVVRQAVAIIALSNFRTNLSRTWEVVYHQDVSRRMAAYIRVAAVAGIWPYMIRGLPSQTQETTGA